MSEARSPVILVGREVRSSGRIIEQLAMSWGAGVVTSPSGKGIISDHLDNMIGGIGEGGNPLFSDLFSKSDFVLLIGTTWWPKGYVPENTQLVQISKRPFPINKGLPTKIGVIGDFEEICQALLNGVRSPKNQVWVQQLHDMKAVWELQNQEEREMTGSPTHPARIIRAIENAVTDDAIITLDFGDSTLWFYRSFRAAQQTVLLSENWRTMGFGLPSALAAKLCDPNREVLSIVGDGGLEMVLADLLTATRYQIKVTLVLFNNGTLQMERDKMMKAGYRQIGSNLTNPDFIKLAKACGWDAYKVEEETELEEQLRKAISSSKPALVDVHTAPIIYPDFT